MIRSAMLSDGRHIQPGRRTAIGGCKDLHGTLTLKLVGRVAEEKEQDRLLWRSVFCAQLGVVVGDTGVAPIVVASWPIGILGRNKWLLAAGRS